MRAWCVAIGVWVVPLGARAETAVTETSCADVATQRSWYDACLYWYGSQGPLYCTPPAISQCWDFEGSGLAGWTTTGTAFARQPTYGDNVAAWRVLQTQSSPLHPMTGSVLDDLNNIGGDYWQTPYPIGNQGRAWLGTYEDRSTPLAPWGVTQGDGPTGVAYSPAFTVDRDLVTMLIGGGCDRATEYVELQTYWPEFTWCTHKFGQPVCHTIPARWLRSVNAAGEELVRTGSCAEPLHRETLTLSGLAGQTVRLAVVDAGSGAWGHINVDHVLHTNTPPTDLNGANQPVWGFADTHAHFGNHLSMRSLDGASNDGYAFHGSPGTITTDRALLATELPSCDGQGHNTNHAARVILEGFEAASLGASPNFPIDCKPGNFGSCGYAGHHVAFNTPVPQQHWGAGVSPWASSDLVGWPYWYTRAHQQMHLTWVQRAYQGGQRLMVASAGNTEVIGMAMRASHTGDYLSDYGALRRFANYMKALASQNSTWMEIALTPADARRIIRQNKLAIVLATEVDDLGDHCSGDFTSTLADDPNDHGRTTSTEGVDPWNQERDRVNAMSCTTSNQWATRIDNLYRAGYRVVMPVHLADNALGGSAIYDEKFNTNSRFMTGSFMSVQTSSQVQYRFPMQPSWSGHAGMWEAMQAGWSRFGLVGGQSVPYTVATFSGAPIAYPYSGSLGHINARGATSLASVVVDALRARGMIIDLAHLGQAGREWMLGLGVYAGNSPLSPGCNFSQAFCLAASYPAISSHAGLRELQPARDLTGGGTNEGGLRGDMIGRIREIGGTVAVGTSAADVRDTDAVLGSSTGIYAQNVTNNCAGSSRSFAQAYIYALRWMDGKGITLGTDINGLEDRFNPRYGTQGCYARGNIPWSRQVAWDGVGLLVNDTSQIPFNYRPAILGLADGSAGAQRWLQRSTPGLRYRHYGAPPTGARFRGLWDPPGYLPMMAGQNFNIGIYGIDDPTSMLSLSALPALAASVTGNRTFDLNYDGMAHYGMLPDLLQDSRVVGVTTEQLGPLFQGAEALIQTWEKGCSLSSPSVSSLGC